MDRYCDQLKINREKVRFLYNGTRLKAENHIGEVSFFLSFFFFF
jgi:hypothetical protein